MKRALMLALAVLVLSTGCAGTDVEILATDDLPRDLYGGGPSTTNQDAEVVVFMVEGNRLVRVARTNPPAGSAAEIAVRALLEGPSGNEPQRGIVTKIPLDTEFLGVSVDNGVASVNLGRGFQSVEDPTDVQEYILRVAQLVWTLDEIPEITSVRLLIAGEPTTVIDQNRRYVSTPVARGRYSRFQPRSSRAVSEAPIDIG
jgi:spore germination protein GerM